MFVKSIGYCAASILLLQLVSAQTTNHGATGTPRIVGGNPSSISTTKYIVKIRKDKVFICGGSLIRPRYVVTAAHCTVNVGKDQLLVIGGATRLTQPGVGRKVDKISVHPNFNKKTFNNDVAVLELITAMTGDNIESINLFTGNFNSITKVKVSGWGRTSENAKNPSDVLRSITVPIIPKSKCNEYYQAFNLHLTNNMFCASNPGTQDACYGDSGGPAVSNKELVGIVSWGVGCARNKLSGVYTKIPSVKQFILNSMQ